MLQATPSLGLAKFLWSNPLQSNPAPMTVSANGETKIVPMKLDASNNDVNNRISSIQHTAEVKNSAEGENSAPKMAGFKEFWNYQMKASEGKWKQYFEQINSNRQYHDSGYDTEIGEVDWGAVRERMALRWRLIQEKPDNMSNEEWQELQEMTANMRPLFIYKTCELFSRMLIDPECRPIFQEFDFY